MVFQEKKTFFILLFLIIIGSCLRFYNLNWGAPFYFHPDERNIASSISQLEFPRELNPHFFAYGSLPIYATYFTGFIVNYLSSCQYSFVNCHVLFEQAIIILRTISATLSVFLIPLTFIVGEKIKKGTGLMSAFFTTMSVGYIQFAHFGTVETLLTFFSVLLFLLLLQALHRQTLLGTILIGLVSGILISIKVSSIVLLILPLLIFAFSSEKKLGERIFLFFVRGLLLVLTAVSIYLLTNPYVFLDLKSFQGSMKYEGGVVLGTLPVFYTGEFFHTIPGIFQIVAIYPFLLNPFITLFFLIAFFWAFQKTVRKKDKKILLLLLFFLVSFIPQAILFAKWTRYMLPTLPFIYLLISLFLAQLPKYRTVLVAVLIATSTLFGFSYFMTAFVEPNTSVIAAEFAKESIPRDSRVISEVYDLGIVPFNEYLPFISLYNFYELDNRNPEYTLQTLNQTLSNTDYLILPSQRILKPRVIHKDIFPVGNKFYSQLLQNKIGFKKVYETPCSLFCEITYLGNPIFRFEETANVFDRPVVMIYKRE